MGLTCHSMYDDSGNKCCDGKTEHECDFVGDSADRDW
eukprot:CAMPEP_0181171754 /NCGR_PEP_ID=MMETSP1096-20121128/2082_1 /TAXON_ID=156174 ORGANISM="Chrysochromulina ericina, Strain CCMP281" /NCGR_SAMPLE_ID=MMETSP1096 /ASSEMBLY_ACC=CAM_ASM_000453 /LENGTH=36 /DNA_ID= /DNA_START= /DNA_END= /DNA_ORIENTATION=